MALRDDMKVYYETFPESLNWCDWCNKSFRTLAGLRNHAVRMHAAEMYRAKNVKCHRCGDTGWLEGNPISGISDEPCGCDEKWEK
jgi:hypothetical protein